MIVFYFIGFYLVISYFGACVYVCIYVYVLCVYLCVVCVYVCGVCFVCMCFRVWCVFCVFVFGVYIMCGVCFVWCVCDRDFVKWEVLFFVVERFGKGVFFLGRLSSFISLVFLVFFRWTGV